MEQTNTGGVKFTGNYFDEAIEYAKEKETTPIEFTRKQTPVYSGVLNYFPDAIREVAQCSYMGNQQHNPDKPLHWDRSKSGDELDALTRHLLEAGTIDTDGHDQFWTLDNAGIDLSGGSCLTENGCWTQIFADKRR